MYAGLLDECRNEIKGAGYERAKLPDFRLRWAGGRLQIYNIEAISFPTAGGDWGTVWYLAIYKKPTGGKPKAEVRLTNGKVFLSLFDIVLFLAGEITIDVIPE